MGRTKTEAGCPDLLIRGGRVVDPANGRDERCDVWIEDGRVVGVGAGASAARRAARVLDATGCYVVPGLIDLHVHISSRYSGRVAHKMLARAGVTTALDMGADPADALDTAARHGAGLTVGSLVSMAPGGNLPGRDAPRPAIAAAIAAGLAGGSLGAKIHYDTALTPAAAAATIAEANRQRAWVAFHCGTTATASDLTGLREAVELAGSHRLHLAHINSYCRGATGDPVAEALQAVELLAGAPHLFSESYLAIINGTSARCIGEEPALARVGMWLRQGGFAPTRDGLREAIRRGHAMVHVVEGDDTVLGTGDAGVAAWEAAGTELGASFAVNPPLPRLMLACARDERGRFAVDALGTDGGGIPRNVLVETGLQLVELGLLSLADWVRKVAWTPARVLGLPDKGHLGVGADADVAIIDPARRRARTTVCRGGVVMHEGVVFGQGSRFLTTPRGEAAVRAAGMAPVVLDLGQSGFYTGEGLKA
jgi:cytosine/adenosine deaminase-related metal-dependent hydrolase